MRTERTKNLRWCSTNGLCHKMCDSYTGCPNFMSSPSGADSTGTGGGSGGGGTTPRAPAVLGQPRDNLEMVYYVAKEGEKAPSSSSASSSSSSSSSSSLVELGRGTGATTIKGSPFQCGLKSEAGNTIERANDKTCREWCTMAGERCYGYTIITDGNG